MYSVGICCESGVRTGKKSSGSRKTKGEAPDTKEATLSHEMDEETPKPTIDPLSPTRKRSKRKIPTCDAKTHVQSYRTLRKFREKQKMLLGDDDIEDPDPFEPTYLFYCFTGMRED
jgi:hypothetical protein